MKKLYILFFFLATHVMCAQLVLNEAAFDVAPTTTSHGGDNNGDGIRSATEDEFLEFVNSGSSSLDISGYQIFDAGDDVTPRHIVPSSTIIAAGEIYVVFGGGDVSAINSLSGVTAHASSTGGLSMGDLGEVMTIKDASDNILITLDGAAIQWDGSEDQSIARSPSITGDFVYHQLADGERHSAGVLQTGPVANTFPLVLNEILADPDATTGDANGDGSVSTADDEFLEFFNNTGSAVDITGYKIYDFTSFNDAVTTIEPVHEFPSTIIPSGGALVVFGGGTPNTTPGYFGDAIVQTATTAGSFKLSLTNSRDAIIITDASDNLVFVLDYGTLGLDFGDNQSITRSPDITGEYVLHTSTSGGLNYSPGLKTDGTTLSNKSLLQKLQFKMYPNPVDNGFVTIQSSSSSIKKVELFDINGRNILKTTLKSNVLDVRNLKSGFYAIRISDNTSSSTSKLIIR